MRRLLLALTLLRFLVASPAAAAACTSFLSAPGPIPRWVEPGTVVCLHAGTYPHAILRITSNNAVYTAAPGEAVTLTATGSLELLGHDLELSHLLIDNSGAGKVPAVVLRGDHDTLSFNEIRGGVYNGVDVRGRFALIQYNSIHNFDTGTPQDDAQCVNAISNLDGQAGGLRLIGNNIHDCSGDGIQAYHANVLPCPVKTDPGEISGNTFTAGTIDFMENAFDTKWNSWLIFSNTISGYGYVIQPASHETSPAGFVHKCSYNTTVTGNSFDHNGKGVEVLGNTGLDNGTNPVSITVSGNTFAFTGPGYTINVVNGLSITVAPNTLYPNGLPTATASPSPTNTKTATATATPTATPTATLSGCWDLRSSLPLSIPCPG